MNLRTVKSPADLKLDGITFECEWRDKQLAAMTLTDNSGHLVRVVLENYNVRALVPALPEKKTMHIVSGTVKVIGTTVREEFEDLFSATSRRSELERAEVLEDVKVTSEEVEIPF